MAFARSAMVTILGLNLLNMFTALQLLTGPEAAVAFDKGQLQTLAYMFLNAQHYGYALGMVFFGLHLGVLGTSSTGRVPAPATGRPDGRVIARLPGRQLCEVPGSPACGDARDGRDRDGPHR